MPRLFLLTFLVLAGCLSRASVETVSPDSAVSTPDAFDHSDFSALLATVVDEGGFVDYTTLAAEPSALDAYLGRLAATDPSGLGDDDRLAFWINAYNAYTLKLVADNYPVESIRDVVKGLFLPLVNSPFKVDFAVVGGETMTLDAIEHGTIRDEFDEPRIHFALVCAAHSCPPLRAEAYVGDRLDAQLDEQGLRFLTNPAKNSVPADDETIRISKIFDWFGGDFGDDDAALQAYIARYFEGNVRESLERGAFDIGYLDYDWSLNDSNPTP